MLCDLRQASPLSFSLLLCKGRVGRAGLLQGRCPACGKLAIAKVSASRGVALAKLVSSSLVHVREDLCSVLARVNLDTEAGLR